MKSYLKVIVVMMVVLGMAACSTKPVKPGTVPAETMPSPPPPVDQGTAIVEEGKFTASDLDSNACLRQRVVYFDYDQDTLKPEFQAIITCHSKYLHDRPGSQMRLEGHADERGTREYNLGLGERRANAIDSAFKANGIDAARINVVSYGEERPLCLDSDESCWSQNRRVEIIYTVK